MSKLIVVTGVTGAQGGSVANTFLQSPGWKIRGITRNPSSESAKAMAAKGVEIVQGDLDDKPSLLQAFQGANVIFSNTDFFTHLFHAMGSPDAIPAGKNPGVYAYEREVEQGMNIADAAEDPSVLETLDRFILSSLADARKWSGGKYTTVYHFDSKAEMIRLTHERCPGVAAKMSTVMMGHYVENWRAFAKMAPQKQEDGSFLMTRSTPADFKMPLFIARRDAGPFVKAATEMPPGKDLAAISVMMSFSEFVEIWGRVHGVKAVYKEISNEEFFEGVPDNMRQELQDAFDFIHEFGFTGGDPSVLAPEQLDVKVPVTSIEEWIREEDWSSVLGA